MPKRQDAIFRAWKEPLMGHAAGLVSEGEEGAEYKIAAQLGWDGGLFASFTSKKKAQLAELEGHMDGNYVLGGAPRGTACGCWEH